jgi:hypothetical protein
MRFSILAAAAVGLALVAGGAYYGLHTYSGQEFRSGLDQAIAALPPGTSATYKDATYSPVTHQAVVTGMTLHGEIAGPNAKGGRPMPFDVTIESLETTNANLDFVTAWTSAAANPAAVPPGKALSVADAIVLKGVTFRSEAINATQDSLRITHPRLYPWALLHEGVPAWKEILASLTPRQRPPALTEMEPILKAEAAIILGVAYDAYEMGPIKGTEKLPQVDVAFEARKMSGNGVDRGVISGANAEGIMVTGNSFGAFSADRVSVSATDVREPLTRLLNGEPPSQAMLNGMKIGKIEYTGMTGQPPGQAATHIGDLSVGPVTFAQGMPVSGSMAWHDFVVTQSQMPDARSRDVFDRLGVDKLTISFAVAYDLDAATRRATLHDTVLKINELGTLTAAAELTDAGNSAAALAQAKLAHAKLRFEDASFVDRALRIGAQQSGLDPAAFRGQIAAMAVQRSAALGGGNPAILAAGRSVSDFVTTPHSLTVELSPSQPVSLLALQAAANNPGALSALLGLTVTSNQP